jgi:hypothetical protein
LLGARAETTIGADKRHYSILAAGAGLEGAAARVPLSGSLATAPEPFSRASEAVFMHIRMRYAVAVATTGLRQISRTHCMML